MWAQKYIATHRVCMYKKEIRSGGREGWGVLGVGRVARRWTVWIIPSLELNTQPKKKKEKASTWSRIKMISLAKNLIEQQFWRWNRSFWEQRQEESSHSRTLWLLFLLEQKRNNNNYIICPASVERFPQFDSEPAVKPARRVKPRSLTPQSRPLEALQEQLGKKEEEEEETTPLLNKTLVMPVRTAPPQLNEERTAVLI